jgi:hypothetical protein
MTISRICSCAVQSALYIIAYAGLVLSSTFYVDPAHGSNRNDGSSGSPWKTLQEVIDSNKIATQEGASYPYVWGQPLKAKNPDAPVRGGDTLILRDGYHGKITILRMYNTGWITIAADKGASPGVHNILVQGASKWRIQGLRVSPELGASTQKIALIDLESHNFSGPVRDIVVEDCEVYSAQEVAAWDTTTWIARACNGIEVAGRQIAVRNNMIRNVDFGISVSDDSVLVEGNTVDRFDGDGLRGVANDLTFIHNVVKNCIVARSANHDDGFQSWSVGDSGVGTGTVYRVKLIGNTIINYTDPNLPLKGTLQGIGCFDGMFEDWDVVNNVVITDHWHGITLSGARNCRIVNNTVCDINSVTPGPPWVRIGMHKDGRLSENCVVRNNLTTALNLDSGNAVVADHNCIIKNTADFFVDYALFDLRLKAGCPAIDSGSASLAPATDITGTARPQGDGIDIGAYEYHAGQQVRRNGGGSRPVAMAARVTISRSKGSFTLRIINPSAPSPVHVRLFDCRGVLERDYGIRSGREIAVRAERLGAGIKLLRVRAESGELILPVPVN